MSGARIHARNLLANWVGHGANMVVLFFLSPFIVHTLGKTEYGIWSLLTVLTGYMGLFDLGARASTGRHIIVYLGLQDHAGVDETIRTGLGFFSLIGLLILGAGVVLGLGFTTFFPSAPSEYHGLVLILLPVLAVNMWLSGVAAIFSSVLTAHDRFDLTQGVNVGVLALNTAGTVLVLRWGYGIAGLTGVVLGCTVLAVAGNYVLARRVYPRLKVWPPALDRPRLRELLGYGLPAALSRASYKIIGQTQLVVVGILVSVAAVTTYSVGAMLVFYSGTFIEQIGNTFFPAVQRAASTGDIESERWYYLRQVRAALIFGLPAYIGFILFGRMFIGLWMAGPEFDDDTVGQAALVMAILSASRLFFLFSFGASPLLWTRGHVWFATIVTAVEAATSLGLAVLFGAALGWGLTGVALGALVSQCLVRGLVLPWRARQILGLSLDGMLRLAGRALVTGMVFAGWCLLIQHVIPGGSWGLFAAEVVAALLGYAVITVVLLVSAADRKRLFGLVRGWVGRN